MRSLWVPIKLKRRTLSVSSRRVCHSNSVGGRTEAIAHDNHIMTSWHGNYFRIPGRLGGNPSVTGGLSQQPSNAEAFFSDHRNKLLYKISRGRWFETSWPLCDVTVMKSWVLTSYCIFHFSVRCSLMSFFQFSCITSSYLSFILMCLSNHVNILMLKAMRRIYDVDISFGPPVTSLECRQMIVMATLLIGNLIHCSTICSG